MSRSRNLDAWKISMQLIKEICLLSSNSHKEISGLTLRSVRNTVAIPKGLSKEVGKKETLQFLLISRASLHEVEILLEIVGRVETVGENKFLKILGLLDQSMFGLNGLINYIRRTELK